MSEHMPPANPLDAWTAAKVGCCGSLHLAADLREYQLQRLRQTVAWVKQHSPFYRWRLDGFDETTLASLGDLQRLPFTAADDLRRNDPPILCVSQSAISHVVTLDTSGTSGPPKRLFFTLDDLEATLDFFDHGMRLPARPGDRVLILFPGDRPGSVGDLLARALERMGAIPIRFGWPHDLGAAVEVLRREPPDVVAGVPVPVLALARADAALNRSRAPMRVRNVLLSADHAAESLRKSLVKLWQCEIFEHYGMTEMGLGGGVDCEAHAGYHMRESELLIEIIDSAGTEPVAPGELGEVVFTTLNRHGMPLIRYRTGDISRQLPGPCKCGSPLTRLERLVRRASGGIRLGRAGQGEVLQIGLLDETIFAVEGVADFDATFLPGESPILKVSVSRADAAVAAEQLGRSVSAALERMPQLASECKVAGLRLEVVVSADQPSLFCAGKRSIRVAAAP